MKHLIKIVSVAAVAALTLSCISAFAKSGKSGAGQETAASQVTVEDKKADRVKPECKGGKDKADKPELTEEEKAAKAEKMKAKLAEKLAEGKITQEEYDAALARIEAGDLKHGHGKGHSKHRPHDKAESETTAE